TAAPFRRTRCAVDGDRTCTGGSDFTRTPVGRIIDATARNIDDFAAGHRNENTLVPAAPPA
ncbi:hypothetical protein ACFU7Y_41410, partial [Kitasatospora sp. NPDC057542]